MSTISTTQLMPLLSTEVVRTFNEQLKIKPKSFLSSFFPVIQSKALYPKAKVRRATEKVAKPVPFGHQGNRNMNNKFSVTTYDLYYFRENLDIIKTDAWFNVFGQTSYNANNVASLIDVIVTEMEVVVDKIMRSKEYQAASVLIDGTADSIDGGSIDFGRNPDSMVDLGLGNYWSTTSNNPYVDIQTGCDWLRTEGKCPSTTFDVIMGSAAYNAFILTDQFQKRQQYYNSSPDTMFLNQMQTTGGLYKGMIDAASYNVRIWVYNDFYEDLNGDMQPYFATNKVVIIPENPDFNTLHGACPLVDASGKSISMEASPYVFNNYIDPARYEHIFDVQSRYLVTPVAVNQMYTMQVLA